MLQRPAQKRHGGGAYGADRGKKTKREEKVSAERSRGLWGPSQLRNCRGFRQRGSEGVPLGSCEDLGSLCQLRPNRFKQKPIAREAPASAKCRGIAKQESVRYISLQHKNEGRTLGRWRDSGNINLFGCSIVRLRRYKSVPGREARTRRKKKKKRAWFGFRRNGITSRGKGAVALGPTFRANEEAANSRCSASERFVNVNPKRKEQSAMSLCLTRQEK